MYDILEPLSKLEPLMKHKRFHVLISDMAPNTSGYISQDHIRSLELANMAFSIAKDTLLNNGHFVVKIFQGGSEKEFINETRKYFHNISILKPAATRPSSKETYLICRKYIRPPMKI